MKNVIILLALVSLYSCSGEKEKDAQKEEQRIIKKDTAQTHSSTEKEEVPGYTGKDIDKLILKLPAGLESNAVLKDSLKMFLEASPELAEYAKKKMDAFLKSNAEMYDMSSSPVSEQWERLVIFSDTDGDIEIVREFLKNNGAKLEQSEGEYYIIANNSFANDIFMPFMSKEEQGFYAIQQYKLDTKFVEDGGLVYSRERYAELAAECESFIKEYPETRFDTELNEIFKDYMSYCMLGIDNTPTINYETNLVLEDVIKTWETIQKQYNNMVVGTILNNLLEEIGDSRKNPTPQFYADLLKNNGIA
jgi:hypothetical protein